MAYDNPRYIAYAKFHGKTPGAMMEYDKKEWPGGCMCGFILWMNEQMTAFQEAHPEAFVGHRKLVDQNAWTKFLQGGTEK